MRIRIQYVFVALAFFACAYKAAPQGTAFNYQGWLNDNGHPTSGVYDFSFVIYDSGVSGQQIGPSLTNAPTAVSNGLFLVQLDFGNGVFLGDSRWLEIGVRTNGSSGAYSVLSPRQSLASSPYAIYAATAGNVSGVGILQAQSLNIGQGNTANGGGTTIAGGSGNAVNGNFSVVSGGSQNIASSNWAAIGGGSANTANGNHSVVSGGELNTASGNHTFVGGGVGNIASSDEDVIVGGVSNSVSGDPAFIGAGSFNKIGPNVIGPTPFGFASGVSSWIASGNNNQVSADFSGIGGGRNNNIQSRADESFIGGGLQNIIATQFGNNTNSVTNGVVTADVIGGGAGNLILNAKYSTIAGGFNNVIQSNANYSYIAAGENNTIQLSATESTIGGGSTNIIQSSTGDSTIAGGQSNTIQNNVFYSTIGGGHGNTIQQNGLSSTISGGALNLIEANVSDANIAGAANSIPGDGSFASIGGGARNTNNGPASVIGGGQANIIQTNAFYSTIGGGNLNLMGANSQSSAIAGGANNTIQPSSFNSVISGGYSNSVSGNYSTVPGGDLNVISGHHSFSAGHRAKALFQGDFLWADSEEADFSSTANDQFLIRATNGVGINMNHPSYTLDVNGDINITGLYRVGGMPQSGSSQWVNGPSSSIYYNSGNVGIGSANPPTEKLDITGNIHLSGSRPAINAGLTQTLTPGNLIAAWGLITVTQSGTITVRNGFNIGSVSSGGTFLYIGFASSIANPMYAILVQDGRPSTGGFPTPITYQPDFYTTDGSQSTSGFILRSPSIPNWNGSLPRDITFSVMVIGD